MVKASGTRRLFHELPTRDKEFVLVDRAVHLILGEGPLDSQTFGMIDERMKRNEETKVVAQRLRSGDKKTNEPIQVMASIRMSSGNKSLCRSGLFLNRLVKSILRSRYAFL